ncbi:MAG: hypothetical protein HRT61_00565 [Ekhidna sp.]|nr:hypothetical protein [Ekhidna sp.]
MSQLKPQKALHLYLDEDKAKPKHVGHDYSVMEKYDGWYMFIDCIDGEWQDITSRNMNVISSMQNYTKMFKEQVPAPKKDCRLIFEGVVFDEATGFPIEFKTVNGWFNRKQPIHKHVTLMCHDIVFFDMEDKPFKLRYENLKQFLSQAAMQKQDILLTLNLVSVLHCSSNKAMWQEIYESICLKYNNNGEGVILKKDDAPYSYGKKNADILKIKCEKTFELKVVGILEGEGKYKGTLGKLKVEDANGVINFVSGMTNTERDLWWSNPLLIVGAIVEVKAMKVLSNKSLREGRYKAVRFDKVEIDAL